MPIGVVAYLLLARPRGALAGLLAAVPATAIAVAVCWGADALAADDPTTAPPSTRAGRRRRHRRLHGPRGRALRLALAGLDRWADGLEIRLPSRGRMVAIAGVVVAVIVVAGVAVGAQDTAQTQWKKFTQAGEVDPAGGSRERLAEVGNNGRLDHWKVALNGAEQPFLHGTGAGTYSNLWARTAPCSSTSRTATRSTSRSSASSASSGSLLIVTPCSTLAGRRVRPRARPDRAIGAAGAAIILMWALRAGIDWDWEMPVVTVWVVILGGALLARPHARRQRSRPDEARAPAHGLGVLVLLITPALITSRRLACSEHPRLPRGRLLRRAQQRPRRERDALGAAEPFLVIGFCDVRIGGRSSASRRCRPRFARPRQLDLPLRPRADEGRRRNDPRPDVRLRAQMDLLSQLTRDALERFDSSDPEVWKQRR